ncbi:hypothetical protein A3F37_03675 [Candidatus Saccharibacteria bacterium RIFCSPHIGHO2_12_FULL_41_12]|nr:MAG: hypothetical protein A3F37_03675 [Candidatus Saccharibacteria bacterium RIFCSPHIGHO2_12_FULL_41_12]
MSSTSNNIKDRVADTSALAVGATERVRKSPGKTVALLAATAVLAAGAADRIRGNTQPVNVLPEAPALTIPRDGPVIPEGQASLQAGVHTYDAPQAKSDSLPQAGPDPEFAKGMAEANEEFDSPPTVETGGAAPDNQDDGGVPPVDPGVNGSLNPHP